MKKLNVKSYNVELLTPEGPKIVPYGVIASIRNVVLASTQQQKLGMAELLRNADIVDKIEASVRKDETVLIEDGDFSIIDQCFSNFKGFGQNEVELCRRIKEARESDVEVEEKGKSKKKG